MPYTKKNCRTSQFHHEAVMFLLVCLYFPHQVFADISPWNVSNNFHSFIGFLQVSWNSMITILVFWLSQAFKFCTYGILIIVRMTISSTQFDFCNAKKSHFWFLCKQTQEKQSMFCYSQKTGFLELITMNFKYKNSSIWFVKMQDYLQFFHQGKFSEKLFACERV